MGTLESMISIYIVIVMLGVGVYMTFLQSKYLDTVNHLERESKFTKVVGYIYIALAIVAFIIYLQ
ncbi:MAG: CLC_0170 family protein [Cellulosilyticaceae bacterium]